MMWMNSYQRQRLPNPRRRRKQRKAVKAGAANDKKSAERLAEHPFQSIYIYIYIYIYSQDALNYKLNQKSED